MVVVKWVSVKSRVPVKNLKPSQRELQRCYLIGADKPTRNRLLPPIQNVVAVRVGRRPPSVRLLEMESDERRKSGPGRWPREGGVENSEANDDQQEEGSTLLLVQISGSKGHGFEQGEQIFFFFFFLSSLERETRGSRRAIKISGKWICLPPQADLEATLRKITDLGADGFIIWGSSDDINTKAKCLQFREYLNNELGPAVKRIALNNNANSRLTVDVSVDQVWP